jgi:hypothetical protein
MTPQQQAVALGNLPDKYHMHMISVYRVILEPQQSLVLLYHSRAASAAVVRAMQSVAGYAT